MAKEQIKIAYFPSNTAKATVLTYNGKTLDNYCVSCTTEEDFSSYTLDARFLIKDNITDLLVEEAILKVQLDYGKEIFRISKVTIGTKYIDIVARQITISDTMTLFLDDVRPTEKNGLSALTYIISNSYGKHKNDITVTSNITKQDTAYYIKKNVYEAIQSTDENAFLTRWGGEIQRRAYNIKIDDKIGSERGFTIREGKNLTGFEGSSNIDNLVTRARGQGYNGILGNWIESPLIGDYENIYSNVIKYEDVKVKDENSDEGYDTLEEAQAELDRRIGLEFSDSNIDKIQATYNINFVQLQNTKEYENYKVAETCYLGDTVRVYIPRIKQDIFVRAISKKYNVMLQKTMEITLSNTITVKPLSSQQIISDLKEHYANEGNNIASYIDSVIKAGISDSYVIYRQNEILVLDNKDITAAINVVRINRNGLAFSQTGYYGEYEYGFTIDGVINANLIRTGILSAIKIQNIDGSFVMDLGGNNGMEFFINDKKSMVINESELTFYDNEGTAIIGGLLSLQKTADSTKKSLVLGHMNNSFLDIAYYDKENNVYNCYMQFDKYNQSTSHDYPITVFEDMDILSRVNHYGMLEFKETGDNKPVAGYFEAGHMLSENVWGIRCMAGFTTFIDNQTNKSVFIRDGGVETNGTNTFNQNNIFYNYSIYKNGTSETGRIFPAVNNNLVVSTTESNKLCLSFKKDEMYYSAMELWRSDVSGGGAVVEIYGDCTCENALTVKGTKNRCVTTESYGDRLLNAYETAECYFGDIGEASTGTEKKIKIELDPIFLETVNTKENYHVFLSKYGRGDIWVSERAETYFIVESDTENLEFSFEIKAKQRDYENTRLEEYINTTTESEGISID